MSLPLVEFELLPAEDTGGTGAAGLIPVRSADSFARMFLSLLPHSRFWEGATTLRLFFMGAADELVRLNERIRDLVREMDPLEADELLEDWESEYGITPGAGDTTEERQLRVQALRLLRQRFRPVDVQNIMAGPLGQDAEDVVVIETTRALALAMDDDQEIYHFFVYRDPALGGTYSVDLAQEILDNNISHSHTKGQVIESISFCCDDPYSRCDRDLLGA